MKIRKAIVSRTGTRLKIDRKRTLVRDHLKKQAAQLPAMHLKDGTQVNHYARLKEIYKLRGEDGVNQYLKNCRQAIRRAIWGRRLTKIALFFGLISSKKITNQAGEN